MKHDNPHVLTTHQVAKRLYVTPTTVIQWINDGKMKVIRTVGGHRRIPIEELNRFIEENKMFLDGENIKTIQIVSDDEKLIHDILDELKAIEKSHDYSAIFSKNSFSAGLTFGKHNSDIVILDVRMNEEISKTYEYIKNWKMKKVKIVMIVYTKEDIEGYDPDMFIETPFTEKTLKSKLSLLF